jgi:RHH-type transcriptional regulator, rel operon repressor / antitoxin RelB
MQTHPSTTFTVRLDETEKARLEALARSTGRSRSHLAAEAISDYLADNEWQVAGIQQALASLEAGRVVEHHPVRDWIDSWGTDHELEMPRPDTA